MKSLLVVTLSIFLACQFRLAGQNLQVNGYRGLWYGSDQQKSGSGISGGCATYGPQYRPAAIYSPEAGKTFFVYGGTTSENESHLLIMVSYYDHRDKAVPRPTIVYDKSGVKEPFDNAAISIDKSGFIWVFISGWLRTRPGMIFKSALPHSIEKFELITELEMIAPQPWWINDKGFIVLFSRATGGRELFCMTSPDGKSWSECRKLTAMGGNYQVSEAFGNRLVTAFNYHAEGTPEKQTNLYFIQTDDFGKTWTNADGKVIEMPLTKPDNDALIKEYLPEGKAVKISDVNFDGYGNPVILVTLTDFAKKAAASEWGVYVRYNGKWEYRKVCDSAHSVEMGSLIVTGDAWRIFAPTVPGRQKGYPGGEIALYTSSDSGQSWTKVKDITSDSRNNNSYVRRPINAEKDFSAFWADGDPCSRSASFLYFTGIKSDEVWLLPYSMSREKQKPERVKQK